MEQNRYAIDGLVPSSVALPSTEQEAAHLLHEAARSGAAVVPWGAGTKQDLGNVPKRVDLVLSVERLNQVVEYVPEDMTITVQAGMRFSDLQALTAWHRQTVPLDPPRADGATVGGIVATASAGPRRTAYGGVRDLVLGTRVALADGRVIKTGGKVVKNVAGYDMTKLMVGSLGTLGIITEVSLRLRPLPAESRTLVCGFAETGPALAAAEAVINSELVPAAVVVLSPGPARRLEAPGPVALAVALEETPENVAYQAGRLPTLAPGGAGWAMLAGEAEARFWDAVRNFGDRFGAPLQMKVNTVISDLEAQMAAAVAAGLDAVAYVPGGTVMLYGRTETPEAAAEIAKARFAAALAAGGSVVLQSAPLAVKRLVDVWGPPRPEWKLTEAIKRVLDPGHTLSPGRFVGGM